MTAVRQNRLNRLQQNSMNAPHELLTACTYYEYLRPKRLRNRSTSLPDNTCGAWLRPAVCSQLLRPAPGLVLANCLRPFTAYARSRDTDISRAYGRTLLADPLFDPYSWPAGCCALYSVAITQSCSPFLAVQFDF
jgi:hypothetical protein